MDIREVLLLLRTLGIGHSEMHEPVEHNRQIILDGRCDILENEGERGWEYGIRGGAEINYAWTDYRRIKTLHELECLLQCYQLDRVGPTLPFLI